MKFSIVLTIGLVIFFAVIGWGTGETHFDSNTPPPKKQISFDEKQFKNLESRIKLKSEESTRVSLRKDAPLSSVSVMLFNKGLELQGRKKYKEAIACYQKVLNESPELFEAQYNIGLSYEALRDYDNAAQVFSNMVKKDPLFDLGLRHLANISYKQGYYDQACSYHQQYLSLARP